MKGWPMVRSGLLRAVTLLAVLAGVLAMHVLTANHHPAVAMHDAAAREIAPAQVRVAGSGMSGHREDAAGLSRDTAVGHLISPVASPGGMQDAGPVLTMGAVAPAVTAGGDHVMGELCVAILTALVLLFLAARRRPCTVLPVDFRRPVPRRVAALLGRSPPWLTPSLSKLCVLRT